jgi:hypothetical protein
MYLSERPVAAVAEQIAHLRGQRLDDADLERTGLRLALVPLDAGIARRPRRSASPCADGPGG